MPEDLGEKTEAATPKRLQDARGKGQVAKSTDLSAAAGLLAAAVVIAVFGPSWAERGVSLMRTTLDMDVRGDVLAVHDMVADASRVAREGAMLIWPLMAIMVLVAAASQIAQVGPLLTAEPLKPKLTRLNPISGVKRIFGKQNVGKTGLSLLKLMFIVAVSLLVIWRLLPSLVMLAALPLNAIVIHVLRAAAELVAWLLLMVTFIGVLDLIWQRYTHKEQLKMTKQEVMDERRSVEGDPTVKQRQRQVMAEATRQRINEAVPNADVIVTNPTHYAVALQYAGDEMNAPKVVAKGVDYLAWRIRQIATRHDVAIVERPPLARALYANVDVGDEVHPEHYEAVAEILAYVYKLRGEEAAA
ncbi:MAG: flagellar biosynthesis protein FlhB [Planctomycetota bacterium]